MTAAGHFTVDGREGCGLTALRRTITPYIGQTLILIALTVFLVLVAGKTSQWNMLWGAALTWGLFAGYVVLFGMKYRIFWNEKSVVMHASGGPERCIRFDEITELCYEIGASQSRPFRRLVVYGCHKNAEGYIDISLRHFHLDDIDRLIGEIHQNRPDLTIPRLPLDRQTR